MSAASLMLDIPEVRARISPVTVEQYRQFPELNANGRRTELIRGIIIEKMSKSPLHSSIARRLFSLLQSGLPGGFIILREDPLTFSDSEPEPDLALVRGVEDDFANKHPSTAALVIEIAVTTAAEDRSMASLYAESGVEEYWIVLPVERRVEIYRRPEGAAYLEHSVAQGDTALECSSVPGIRIPLAGLFG